MREIPILIAVAIVIVNEGCGKPRATPNQMSLRQRAKAFLERPIPDDMEYVPDSISERLIREYADSGKVALDPELVELAQICLIEANASAENGSPAKRAYFQESGSILREILDSR